MSFFRRQDSARFLGIFTCLGSLAGLISTFDGFRADDGASIGFFFLSIAFAYFLWGSFIGASYSFDQKRFRRQCIWFWWLQAPVLNSAYFTFHAVIGAFCAFWLRLDVYDIGFAAGIASQFLISFMSGGPFSIGINLLALVVVLLLKNVKGAETSS